MAAFSKAEIVTDRICTLLMCLAFVGLLCGIAGVIVIKSQWPIAVIVVSVVLLVGSFLVKSSNIKG